MRSLFLAAVGFIGSQTLIADNNPARNYEGFTGSGFYLEDSKIKDALKKWKVPDTHKDRIFTLLNENFGPQAHGSKPNWESTEIYFKAYGSDPRFSDYLINAYPYAKRRGLSNSESLGLTLFRYSTESDSGKF